MKLKLTLFKNFLSYIRVIDKGRRQQEFSYSWSKKSALNHWMGAHQEQFKTC